MGCSRFARRYSGNRGCFLFLEVLRCFSSPGSPRLGYGFTQRWSDMTRTGFPHSGILGLASVCDYPRLIAAYHALHRLLMPRHPPYTLSSLTPNRIATRGLNLVETRITYSIVKEQCELCSRNRRTRIRSCRICSSADSQEPEHRQSVGGDERNRTADPLLAKQVLSRLSYIPDPMRNTECGLRNSTFRIPHSAFAWWAFLGSNQGPHAYQACALTS